MGRSAGPSDPVVLRSATVRRPWALRDVLGSERHRWHGTAPGEGPFERIVVQTDESPHDAEAWAVHARRAGRSIVWGAPVEMTVQQLLDWRRTRGRESLELARRDPALLSTIELGSWFNSPWQVRVVRRSFIAAPPSVREPMVRLLAHFRSTTAARLALDAAFWSGVRSSASDTEWAQLACSSYVALCYHRVTPEPGPGQERMTVPPDRFRTHLRLLRSLGYRPMTSEELMFFHRNGTGGGGRRFLLTVDDGFADAVSAVVDAGVPAQFFVPSDAIGQEPWWTVGGRIADWPELTRATEAAVSVGSHGRRHRPLTELDPSDLEDELKGSRAELEDRLGKPCSAIAYPNGRYDSTVRAAAIDAGYEVAFTTDPGRNGVGTDPLCLRRVTPKAWDGSISFLYRVLTGEPVPHRWDERRRHRPRSVRSLASRTFERVRDMSPGRRLRGAAVAQALAARVSLSDTALILDAGSDEAIVSAAIARRAPAWWFVCVDLSADALLRGRRRASFHSLHNLDFVRADVTNLLRSEMFDVALTIDSLTEVPDDDAAIAEIARSLRPGGLLVVHTPVIDWRPALSGSRSAWRRAVRRGYALAALTGKLESAGLVVDLVEPTFRTLGHLAQEVHDRWVKGRHPAVQFLAYPLLVGAVELERRRMTWGPNRAMLVVAHRDDLRKRARGSL